METRNQRTGVIQGPFGFTLNYTAILVMLTGLIGTAISFLIFTSIIRQDEERRFAMAYEQIEGLIQSRFDRFQIALMHTRAFLDSKERISREDFRNFLRSVEIRRVYPGLQGIGWAEKVYRKNKRAHEREVREDGFRGYHIWPPSQEGRFYPGKFFEPDEKRHEKILGFDMHTEKNRAEAMDRARDKGEAALSAVIDLKKNGDGPKAGFQLYLPVYKRGASTATVAQKRRAISGFVFGPFLARDFFSEIISSEPFFRQGVAFAVYDGDTPSPATLVFASEPGRSDADAKHRKLLRLPLAGHSWAVLIYTTKNFASPANHYAPLLILLLGLLITLLIGIAVSIAGRQAELERDRVEARDEFLSICSHELRTPLTSLKLQNQLVQRTFARDPSLGETTRLAKMVRESERQIDRLVGLVEEMLDISRIRAGRLALRMENLDLAGVVRETAERVHLLSPAKKWPLEIIVPDTLPGRGDQLRIEQVLVNLLTNSMKYGEGKPVRVELHRTGDNAFLTVRDHGIGIAPENQAKIFERFERAVPNNHVSGLGIGLYIARQIVEFHGGSISVDSKLGCGSLFTVKLPLTPPDPQLAETPMTLN